MTSSRDRGRSLVLSATSAAIALVLGLTLLLQLQLQLQPRSSTALRIHSGGDAAADVVAEGGKDGRRELASAGGVAISNNVTSNRLSRTDDGTVINIGDGRRALRITTTTTSAARRRLAECPPLLSDRPPPRRPPLPTLSKSTYAASFPGSGDGIITRHFVEAVTGLYVGESAVSPSFAKQDALRASGAYAADADASGVGEGGGGFDGSDGVGGIEGMRGREDGESRGEGMSERGQGEVVVVRTRFPHTSGKLASWDRDIPRAIVILRNPLHAIPTYFNHMYEVRNHLPPGAATNREHAEDSMNAWIKWRDSQLPSQIMLYRRFVSFWMEKYLAYQGNRIYFSYEDFVDEEKGPIEASRLASFLEEGMKSSALEWVKRSLDRTIAKAGGDVSEGGVPMFDELLKKGLSPSDLTDAVISQSTRTMVDAEDVPCLWEEVVHSNVIASSGGGDRRNRRRGRRLQGGGDDDNNSSRVSFDGGDWDPEGRPFTPENLAMISGVVLELMNRWSRHQRVLNILSRYHREISRVYLEAAGQLSEEPPRRGDSGESDLDGESTSQMEEETRPPAALNFHIVLASRRPSTKDKTKSVMAVATNWLMGLFEPQQEEVTFMDDNWPESPIKMSGRDVTLDATIVTRTHRSDLITIYKHARPNFDEVFFVVTNINNSKHESCSYKNVLCLDPSELLFNTEEELHNMVRTSTKKFRERFSDFFGETHYLSLESELNAVERLGAMMDRGGEVHRRRRLSVALPNGGCEITWPKPATMQVQMSYAASYPGCGARMSWNLIEALTGLWTGDDWDNNQRGKRVVSVKTHYPHDAGRLVSWDDEITRALVIIRNPMYSIPSFFNHIYEIKNNLRIHSQRAPVDDWIQWRDQFAGEQIHKFGKFIDYWMKRFENDDDRVFISYESMTNDHEGAKEATRMNEFFAQSEGVNPIENEAVPCIWKAVVKYKDPAKAVDSKGRRRLDPKHHDSKRAGPTDRPYTPELMDAMSQMLHDLIQKWGKRHQRLRVILESYLGAVQAAKAAITYIPPHLKSLQQQVKQVNSVHRQPAGRNFHIIQVSLPHAGSSVLNNILTGLFDPEAEYKKSSIITTTHDTDLLTLYKNERPKYDEIFFVASNRGNNSNERVSPETCEYSNVLCIEYEELMYDNSQDRIKAVNNLSDKFQRRFGSYFGPDYPDENSRVDALKRLEAMDNAKAAIGGQAVEMNAGGSDTDSDSLSRKSFHIFNTSPPHTASAVVTNWLMGLFEPDKDFSFMVDNPQQSVRIRGTNVPLDSTLVTKTHIIDIFGLYRQYRSRFDEVFFVASSRGSNPETRIDSSYCEYDNVLCLEYEELLYSDEQGIEVVVNKLTEKFRNRFQYFFGANPEYFGEDKIASAVRRLKSMSNIAAYLSGQSYTATDQKYGVHGGHNYNRINAHR